ncbi:HNH endonuclease [Pelomonas sp. Root1217]|uniref:HNH endonuclease n=1 Tax=Pelomonas sp. Root1217 TaxID=1736430 RepID=UPI000AD52709|nr:HNH endonuclease [Pelomonas sp. Root1217]
MQRYPPKKILSLATGVPVADFTGGPPTNNVFAALRYPVELLDHGDGAIDRPLIPAFKVGHAYSRVQEITGKFGGSGQSGIAPSRTSPAIFLFTGGSGAQYGYADEFEQSGCLLYAGEGQVGDMQLARGNLAVVNHVQDGRALHVFESQGKGRDYVYRGEYLYTSHLVRKGPDREGAQRDILVFRLMPVEQLLPIEGSGVSESLATADGPVDLSALRLAAMAAVSAPGGIADAAEAVRRTYQRSAKVRAYALARAAGICELCSEAAPFQRKSDGSPYLEPHHINRVSDGGLDHPRHLGAICPTCHREIHFGVGGDALNDRLRAVVFAREDAMDGAEL